VPREHDTHLVSGELKIEATAKLEAEVPTR
jgi:hypothetical protein